MAKRPNLLLFMTDHQRGDTVLPAHPCQTPNGTGWRGGLLHRAYCPRRTAAPSRATFFTGLYPSRHGVWNNICNAQALSAGPREGVRLFSQELRAAGYRLAYDGKWHVSIEQRPADYGWEELIVTSAKGDHHGVDWEQWRRFREPKETGERAPGQVRRPGWGDYRLYRTLPDDAPAGHDDASSPVPWRRCRALAQGGEPWCLYVGLVGPHDLTTCPGATWSSTPGGGALPPSFADDLADKPRVVQRLRRQWSQLSEREVRDTIRHFWAYCTYLDALFGEVLQALDATGQAEDTLVLYVADHGDYLGDHGLFLKGIPCYRGAYHVPCVMRWPNGIAHPGRQVEALVSLADLAPTFVGLGGATSPQRPIGTAWRRS